MATASICVTYTIDLPEVEEIYDGDPDLIDEKLDELEDEISNDPFYFIERFGRNHFQKGRSKAGGYVL